MKTNEKNKHHQHQRNVCISRTFFVESLQDCTILTSNTQNETTHIPLQLLVNKHPLCLTQSSCNAYEKRPPCVIRYTPTKRERKKSNAIMYLRPLPFPFFISAVLCSFIFGEFFRNIGLSPQILIGLSEEQILSIFEPQSPPRAPQQ